jgi:hypothetical protein
MSFIAVHFLRFLSDQRVDEARCTPSGGALFQFWGVDEPMTPVGLARKGRVWCCIEVFSDRKKAEASLHAGPTLRCGEAAVEQWSALLAPTHHRGELNWPSAPLAGSPDVNTESAGPVVVLTTVGFAADRLDFDMARAVRFGLDVNLQRATMAETPGLVFHHAFYAHDPLIDAITFSLWRDAASMQAFAYAPGSHRTQVDRFRAEGLADRSSFTRLRVLATNGEWNGAAP